jgi:gamma-glutamylputrescine oxidase
MTWSCWKPTASASALRGGTAGRSAAASGRIRSGSRKTVGKDNAHQLWDLAEEAKTLVKTLVKDHAMPVTFHPGIAHACRTEAEVRETHAYAEKLHRDYGYTHLEPLDRAGIRRLIGSTDYVGGEIDRDAGHLHPLNYAIGLAQAAAKAGVRIHELSEVHRVEPGPRPVVRTPSGHVDCATVILAGNGYLGQLEPQGCGKGHADQQLHRRNGTFG